MSKNVFLLLIFLCTFSHVQMCFLEQCFFVKINGLTVAILLSTAVN